MEVEKKKECTGTKLGWLAGWLAGWKVQQSSKLGRTDDAGQTGHIIIRA